MLPFTHAATTPIVNRLGFVPYTETFNPQTFVGTSYKETFESGENSRVNGFQFCKECESICSGVRFSNLLPLNSTAKQGNNIA
jgi:hypothetical protein